MCLEMEGIRVTEGQIAQMRIERDGDTPSSGVVMLLNTDYSSMAEAVRFLGIQTIDMGEESDQLAKAT